VTGTDTDLKPLAGGATVDAARQWLARDKARSLGLDDQKHSFLNVIRRSSLRLE